MRHDIIRSSVRAFSVAAIVFAAMSSYAFAEDAVAPPAKQRAPAIMLSDKPDMLAKVNSVCQSDKFTLSVKAKSVCVTHDLKLTSKGNLRNQGVGGEFATLIRQEGGDK